MIKVAITHVDMDCENIATLASTARSSDRVSTLDKHMPMHSHKLIGKDH